MKKSKFLIWVWLWFCLLDYIIPGFYHFINNQAFVGKFSNASNKYLIMPILAYVISTIPIPYLVKSKLTNRKLHFNLLMRTNFVYLIMITALIISIRFRLEFGMSFRHKESFNENGLIPILYFIINSFSKNFILFIFILKNYGLQISKKLKLLNIVLTLCLLIGFNGSLDIIFILIGTAISLNPRFVGLNLNTARLYGTKLRNVLISSFIVAGVVFGGFYNKYGDETIEFLSDNFDAVQEIIMVRVSMHYQSTISAIPNINSTANFDLMSNIFSENYYRFCIFFGGECSKSFDGSISRFNWEQVHLYHYSDIAGMAPGIFSFPIIITPFPIGIFLLYLFLSIVFTRLKSVFIYQYKNEHLMAILLMFLLYPIFNSFDLLFIPLSKGFLNFLFFIIFNNSLQNILLNSYGQNPNNIARSWNS